MADEIFPGSFVPAFALGEEQVKLFCVLGSELVLTRDEKEQYRQILERLRAAANAQVAALILFEEERRRWVFQTATGLNCQEGSISSLVWSYGKRLQAGKKDLEEGFVITAEEMANRSELLFERMLGFKSFCFHPLKVDQRVLGGVLLGNRRNGLNFFKRDLRRLIPAAQNAASDLERVRLYRELKGVFINSVRAFVSAIDAKDPYTHGHSERVTEYSVKIAKTLAWSEERIDALLMSAILHDVGKIGVPEQILSKPARLTDDEYAVIKRHPEIGAKIIGEIPQLNHALTGILFHHERYDGKGYPQQLGGVEIPIFGRLISVADAFDAMTSDRPYRKGLDRREAMKEIMTHCGKQFDPEMVAAFMQAFERGAIV
jgi:HD-GYP domain-containing protein (c-di-GMP phosphodiesterase class II)